jgi:hypothetical protein
MLLASQLFQGAEIRHSVENGKIRKLIKQGKDEFKLGNAYQRFTTAHPLFIMLTLLAKLQILRRRRNGERGDELDAHFTFFFGKVKV